MSTIASQVTPGALLLCNESFASANEREGSEIARQIIRALTEAGIRIVFVTHLCDLAGSLHARQDPAMLFLRAERRPRRAPHLPPAARRAAADQLRPGPVPVSIRHRGPGRAGMTGGAVEVDVMIEIPQGSRNKYEMDHASGRIRLDRMLFTSTRYPLDYGFVPDTLAEDGDPLDILVMLDEPTFPGCELRARPIAVFWMSDEHGPDAKILAVPARDPRYDAVRDLADVPGHLTTEIGHFFEVYKEIEPGKRTDVRGWEDRACAERVVEESFARARDLTAHPGALRRDGATCTCCTYSGDPARLSAGRRVRRQGAP